MGLLNTTITRFRESLAWKLKFPYDLSYSSMAEFSACTCLWCNQYFQGTYSLNVKRVKKRVNANSLEKEWKPLKKSCYPLEKERKEKKKWDFSLEKEWKKSESEHHSKMYCPPFKSLKSGHSLAESELHSFSSE